MVPNWNLSFRLKLQVFLISRVWFGTGSTPMSFSIQIRRAYVESAISLRTRYRSFGGQWHTRHFFECHPFQGSASFFGILFSQAFSLGYVGSRLRRLLILSRCSSFACSSASSRACPKRRRRDDKVAHGCNPGD